VTEYFFSEFCVARNIYVTSEWESIESPAPPPPPEIARVIAPESRARRRRDKQNWRMDQVETGESGLEREFAELVGRQRHEEKLSGLAIESCEACGR
jgi:hypothetical protein